MIIKTRNGFRGRVIERVRRDHVASSAWFYTNMLGASPSLEIALIDQNGNEYKVSMNKRDIQLLIEAYNNHNKLEGM